MKGDDSILIPLQDPNEYNWELFRRLQPDKNGEVSLKVFKKWLHRVSNHQLSECAVMTLLHKADKDNNGKISYEEFVEIARSTAFRNMGGLMCRAMTFASHVVLPRHKHHLHRHKYRDEYSWRKRPPFFMISISFIELILFVYHATILYDRHGYIGPEGPAPKDSIFIYDPDRRREIWRFISYALVHSGYMHITVNIIVQLVLGIPLELVHSWWRVYVVYMAGVLAGSLATSITDPTVLLAGASGGVYALLTAHLATTIMNWGEMGHPILRVIIMTGLAGVDVGFTIYHRHMGINTNVSYVAHLAGAIAGILVGVFVLRNLESHRWERVLSRICFFTYTLLMAGAIIWNVVFFAFSWEQALGVITAKMQIIHTNKTE